MKSGQVFSVNEVNIINVTADHFIYGIKID